MPPKQKSRDGGAGRGRQLMPPPQLFFLLAAGLLLATLSFQSRKGLRSYVSSILSSAGGGARIRKTRPPTVEVYTNASSFPRLLSSGPHVVNPGTVGLYKFSDVCVTKHQTSSYLRGLVYFLNESDPQLSNPMRCVTCSAPLNHRGGWNGTGRDAEVVGHTCGFECIHAMYARDVEDWNDCRVTEKAKHQARVWGQVQYPVTAEAVHYYKSPVYLLDFRSENIGHSLFDTLLVWLPHWYMYRNKAGGSFPFEHVVSDSLHGCLESSTFWFCEILRSMDAFGTDPFELPPPPDVKMTLYCYETLYVSHVALQRKLWYPEALPKSVFDEFRDIMFERYGLPRNRNGTASSSAAGTVVKKKRRKMSRRVSILLYAHEPSGRRVWEGMNNLVDSARTNGKYSHVDLLVVRDFDVPIQEQATLFNTADGFVMTHGAQMANSIFAVDGAVFYELGCSIPSFLGNSHFMRLLGGTYKGVQACPSKRPKPDDVCLRCDADLLYGNFSMSNAGFERMLDGMLDKLSTYTNG